MQGVVRVFTEFALEHDLPNRMLKHLSHGALQILTAAHDAPDKAIAVIHALQISFDSTKLQLEQQAKAEAKAEANAKEANAQGSITSWLKSHLPFGGLQLSLPPPSPPESKIGRSRFGRVVAGRGQM